MSPSILQDQFGIGEEVTPGTAVTPTRFYDFGQENVNQSIERIEYMGIRPNRKVLGSNNWVAGRIGVGGDVELPVMNKDFGLIFKHALGNIATTTPTGATLARDHKATVGAIDGKSLTVQVGRTDVTGTTRPFTYAGVKLDQWELNHDTSSQLMFKTTVDGSSETTATGLATASYSTNLTPWAYTKVVLTLGGSSIDVTEWNLKANNNLAKDRYFMRGTTPGSKKEQLEGADVREYTGSLKAEFAGLTDYNRFVNGTVATLQAVYTGAIIEAALSYQLTVVLDTIRIDGDTPNVAGLGIKEQMLPFKVLDAAAADGPVVVVVRTDQVNP
jgi:hypothetical protein